MQSKVSNDGTVQINEYYMDSEQIFKTKKTSTKTKFLNFCKKFITFLVSRIGSYSIICILTNFRLDNFICFLINNRLDDFNGEKFINFNNYLNCLIFFSVDTKRLDMSWLEVINIILYL